MKNRKKIVSALLVTIMAAGIAGCGSSVPANSVHSIDDLPGKTIGVQLGTTGDIVYASDYECDDAGSKVERYNKGTDAVQALKTGKIDCVIIDEQPAKAFVAKNDDLQILTDAFDEEEYAICIAKDNSDLTSAFNSAIAELKSDGTLDDIVNNYIGDDAGKTPYETPEGTEYPNGTLIMATNAAFEPYEYYKGSEVVGIDVDMAKAICDKLGYELKVEDMEFDAIIAAVSSGKADFGAAGMTVTEDRLKNIDFTDTYTTAHQVLIVRKN
jgi:polar amino acid transport system substrate-binding protein